MPQEPQDDLRDRLRAYADAVESEYRATCEAAPARFSDSGRLLLRFRTAVADFERGRSSFGAVDEAHNEICVAAAMLDHNTSVSRLTYEPTLPGSRKTIDFEAELTTGQVIFVDVKTIRPDATDRWEQYERALQEEWFPPGVEVDLAEHALGGEIWHDMTAARGRMLQYTLELEGKIAAITSTSSNTRFVLALCGDGVRWTQDELEDFVAFYATGRHRSDDSLARMERDYMQKRSLRFSRTVHQFAWVCRSQRDIRPTQISWNVRQSEDPAFA